MVLMYLIICPWCCQSNQFVACYRGEQRAKLIQSWRGILACDLSPTRSIPLLFLLHACFLAAQPSFNALSRTLRIKTQFGTGTIFNIDVNGREYWVTAKHILTGAKGKPFGHIDQQTVQVEMLNPGGEGLQWLPVKFTVLQPVEDVDIVALVPANLLLITVKDPSPPIRGEVPQMFSWSTNAVRSILRGAIFSTLLAVRLPAQSPEWVKPSLPSVPSARCCGAVTYDSDTQSTVLFGGGNEAVAYSDTWLFTRTAGWTQLSPATSPPPTSGPGFAYDPITKTAVLFGGNPGNFDYVNDTWTWDGTPWTQQFPPVSPSARAFNTEPMAFDAARGTVVLFGGYVNGGSSWVGDTWLWKGKVWIERHPAISPSQRGTTVAYDSARQQIIIFGGQNADGFLSDTWTWDGITWTQQFPASSPSARTNHGMAYDANTGAVILFGGYSPTGESLNDTWSWSETTWTQIQTPFTPSGRYNSSMNYDPNFKGLLLFGGANGGGYTNTTWFFVH